jgi:hypothetical protein
MNEQGVLTVNAKSNIAFVPLVENNEVIYFQRVVLWFDEWTCKQRNIAPVYSFLVGTEFGKQELSKWLYDNRTIAFENSIPGTSKFGRNPKKPMEIRTHAIIPIINLTDGKCESKMLQYYQRQLLSKRFSSGMVYHLFFGSNKKYVVDKVRRYDGDVFEVEFDYESYFKYNPKQIIDDLKFKYNVQIPNLDFF